MATVPPLTERQRSELSDVLAKDGVISAIKQYREWTGLGLAEAKAAVEAFQRGNEPTRLGSDAEVANLLTVGHKTEAIKLVRERTGAGLKQAKEVVDSVAESRGIKAPESSSGVVVFVIVLIIVAAFFWWARYG